MRASARTGAIQALLTGTTGNARHDRHAPAAHDRAVGSGDEVRDFRALLRSRGRGAQRWESRLTLTSALVQSGLQGRNSPPVLGSNMVLSM